MGAHNGLFKSTDEGKKFTQINSDIKNVSAITFDESDSKVIYVATVNGELYRSDDGGENWSKAQ